MTSPAWWLFAGASLTAALTAGFALGGLLFLARALLWPTGIWWLASAQAHGHLQLFGWAGLMVLGVGFHFLPRLRGAPLVQPQRAQTVLGLLGTGLALRAVAQPALTVAGSGTAGLVLRIALVLSGALELAGATLAVAMLAGNVRRGPNVRQRAGLWPVLPFFVTAFAAFWLALVTNLAGITAAVWHASALVSGRVDQWVVQVALYAFLVPMSVAMSARTFPLYFRMPLPNPGPLWIGLLLLLLGLGLRFVGEAASIPLLAGLGQLGLAAALGTFVLVLGIFAPRRPLPRQPVRPLQDPLQLHAVSAYVWLSAAAVLLTLSGLAALGLLLPTFPPDVERHVLGAGFVTLLILGMAAHLLPGFRGRPLRSRGLVWLTLALGNAAALLRVVPIALPSLVSASAASLLLALAGLAGVAAVATLAFNLATGPGSPRPSLSGKQVRSP